MNDTSVYAESITRILGLIHELKDGMPAQNAIGRRSLETLVRRLSEPLSPELRAAVRQQNDDWQPRLPR